MNNDIVVMEKPDSVPWDTIHEVLWAAHESTRKDGIFYPTSEMTGEEIAEYMAKNDAHCIVAMDGDKVAGTMTHHIVNVKNRLFKGRFLMLSLAGNMPEYKGRGVFSGIYNACLDYAKANNLDGMLFGTAEKNYTMRNIFERKGFFLYRCHYNKDKNRYVVGGALCFNGLPHKKWYCTLHFKLKQIIAHIKRK